MSCLAVPGARWVLASATLGVPRRLLVSRRHTCLHLTSKQGPAGCSHSHLDGNKQLLTKEEKTQTGQWGCPGRGDLWLTIFFF